MNKKLVANVSKLFKTCDKRYEVPSYKKLGLKEEQYRCFLLGGRKEGLKLLKVFLFDNGENYSTEMSSPITA